MLIASVPVAPGYWVERRFRAMGSTAHLLVGDAHEALVDWAVAEIERLEQSWSRFRPDSELVRLGARSGEWVMVSAELFDALRRARALWEHTAGAFDPTVLRSLVALGYDQTFSRVLDAPDECPPRGVAAPGFGAVALDEDKRAVWLPPEVRLDLGGIGKGLAADLVAEGLVQRGAASALVALGGDIRTAGTVPPGGWRIPVEDPFDEAETWREVVLGDGAVVTSTTLLRRWRRGGVELHHLVDPLAGMPAQTGVVAVVARGPQAWWAEGIAKAALVLGERAAPALLAGSGVTASLFRADRTTVTIEGSAEPCSAS